MSTADIKLHLFRLIDNTDDVSILKKIYSSLSKTLSPKEKDWWNSISDKEREEIEEGLAQVERGEIISHEEVMKASSKLISKYRK